MTMANFISTSVIIPAAGFGKRVGSPAAKELFLDPQTGKPLIDFAIQAALKHGFQPVVVLRKDKLALHEYLLGQPGIEIVLIEGSREWPDTVLQSAANWRERNFMLLPDTRFAPISILPEMNEYLETGDLAFASFAIASARSWGVLQIRDQSSIRGCEKPQTDEPLRAWGVLGFGKEVGERFFKALLKSTLDHEWYALEMKAREWTLDFFTDLTRI
jgi:bifunctional N-acetylglucosamine-1-phosphate-uridyltransferase/glucosamine-1-phosphate-acetyltransferase GlmU-like protein